MSVLLLTHSAGLRHDTGPHHPECPDRLRAVLDTDTYHEIDDQWAVMADVQWTGWSRFKDLNVNYTSNGTLLTSTHEGWRDTWFFAVGATYKWMPGHTIRVGAEYIARLLPTGTHNYGEFIKPSELAAWLREAGLQLENVSGLMYEPWRNAARLTSRTDVNYLASARKPE